MFIFTEGVVYGIKTGKEPVPFAIIFVTIEIDADIEFTSFIFAPYEPKIYCWASVTLIFADVFNITCGVGINESLIDAVVILLAYLIASTVSIVCEPLPLACDGNW